MPFMRRSLKRMPPAKNPRRPSYGISVIMPSRWFELPHFERDWASNFVKELGRLHSDVAVLPYPGFAVGENRGGIVFAEGACDHFKDQVLERLWRTPRGLVVFVGEASSPEVFHQVIQYSPFIYRASVPFIGLPRHAADVNGNKHFSHFLIFPGAWNRGNGSKNGDGMNPLDNVRFFESGVDAARFLHKQFRHFNKLNQLYKESGAKGLTVVAAQPELADAARRLVKSSGGRGEVLILDSVRDVSGSSQVRMASTRLAKARYRRILFLNEGVVSAKGLSRMMHYLDRHPLLGVVGAMPVKRAPSGRPKPSSPMGFIHAENGKSVFPMAWLTRRRTLLSAGYFDARFKTLDAAVADYCFRIRQLGFHVFSAGEIHAAGRSIRKPLLLEKKWRMSKQEDILKLCRKWHPQAISPVQSSLGLHETMKATADV